MTDINKYTAEFLSPELEQEFRLTSLKQDARWIIGILCLGVGLLLYSTINDLIFMGMTARFFQIWYVKGIFLIVWGTLMVLTIRTKSVIPYDIQVLLFGMSISVIHTLIVFTRPTDYIMNVVYDVVVTYGFYVIFPTRLVNQAIAGVVFTVSQLAMIVWYKTNVSAHEMNIIFQAYIVTNLVGFYFARRMHTQRRIGYATLQSEIEAKNKLQEALENIKTLREMIPICAWCKKIRNDTGYWEQLEEHISKHTDSEFSHSICPECREQFRDDLKDHT